MVYQLPSQVINQTGGLEVTAVYLSNQVPILFPSILVFFWALIALGGYIQEEKRYGHGSFWQWGALGGVFTTVASYILFLYPGIMSIWTVTIFLVITLGLGLAHFYSERY